MRELDQTIVPGTLAPIAFIATASSCSGASSDPLGGAPESEPQPASSSSAPASSSQRVARPKAGNELGTVSETSVMRRSFVG